MGQAITRATTRPAQVVAAREQVHFRGDAIVVIGVKNKGSSSTTDCGLQEIQGALEILPIPILILDSCCRIVFSNNTFRTLLAYTKEELEFYAFEYLISARDPLSVIGVDNILRESEFTVSLCTKTYDILDLCCSPSAVSLDGEETGTLLVFHNSHRLRTAMREEERAFSIASERGIHLDKALNDLSSANRQIKQFQLLMDQQVERRTARLKKEMAEAICLRQRAESQAKKLAELEEKKNSLFQSISHELRDPLDHLLSPLKAELMEHPENHNLETAFSNSVRLLHLVKQLPDFQGEGTGQEQLLLHSLNIK